MFKQTKKENTMGKDVGAKGINELNRIVEGTTLTGDIDCATNIRVDGVVKGTIKTTAKLVVGPTGKIEGHITCKEGDIQGNVLGDVHTKDKLALKATAIIEGNVICDKLIVEEGAKVNGKLNMHKTTSEVNINSGERKRG